MCFCKPNECPEDKLFVEAVLLIGLAFIPAAQPLGEEEVQKFSGTILLPDWTVSFSFPGLDFLRR